MWVKAIKASVLFNKWLWDHWMLTRKRMKVNLDITSYTKIHSKWIKDLNVTATIVKHLEENTGVSLCDLELGNGFLDRTPKSQAA